MHRLFVHENRCKFCNMLFSNMDYYVNNLKHDIVGSHIKTHFGKIISYPVGCVPQIIFENKKRHSCQTYDGGDIVRDIFPQLIVLDFVNVISPLDLFDDELYTGNYYSELRNFFVNLLPKLNYKCVICGDVYDCGLPTKEMALRHSVSCYQLRKLNA